MSELEAALTRNERSIRLLRLRLLQHGHLQDQLLAGLQELARLAAPPDGRPRAMAPEVR